MPADTTDHDLTFTIRALDDPGGEEGKAVPADVFARKMQEILDALKEADKAANHGTRHQYFIADLKKGSAEVTFEERPLPAFVDAPLRSSLLEFETCVAAIHHDDMAEARKYNGLVDKVLRVASGAGQRFSYIEIGRRKERGYRADSLFLSQARRMSNDLHVQKAAEKPPRLFRGQSFEGFDGAIKEVDLRSKNSPRCRLVLADGTGELDCEFVGFTIDEIREHLDCRVWAEGAAVYDGESGMPVRLDIRALRKIVPKNHLSKWRGHVDTSKGDDWFE